MSGSHTDSFDAQSEYLVGEGTTRKDERSVPLVLFFSSILTDPNIPLPTQIAEHDIKREFAVCERSLSTHLFCCCIYLLHVASCFYSHYVAQLWHIGHRHAVVSMKHEACNFWWHLILF